MHVQIDTYTHTHIALLLGIFRWGEFLGFLLTICFYSMMNLLILKLSLDSGILLGGVLFREVAMDSKVRWKGASESQRGTIFNSQKVTAVRNLT